MSDKRDLLLMEVNGGCCKYLDFVFSKNHFNEIVINYKILHSLPLGDILLHIERLSRATFVAAKRVNPLTTFLCETTFHCYNRSFCFTGAITKDDVRIPHNSFYSPNTVTLILRASLGPSNSIKKIVCQLPIAILLSLIGIVSDPPVISAIK